MGTLVDVGRWSLVVGRWSDVVGRWSLVGLLLAVCSVAVGAQRANTNDLPELTQPVNDFAHVIDPQNAATIDQMIRRLKTATGDVVVVATVNTIEPYGDIREYANKLFENHGKGIGQKGKDNGLLILLAIKERKVWVEVGYTLEQWITDGFSGETSRNYMVPQFRSGSYGAGMRAGTERIIGRIASGRGVTLDGVRPVAADRPRSAARPSRSGFSSSSSSSSQSSAASAAAPGRPFADVTAGVSGRGAGGRVVSDRSAEVGAAAVAVDSAAALAGSAAG